MNQNLTPFVFTIATVSLLHALLPTHWLPFVLVGKTEQWTRKKILSLVLLAGGGHVAMTAILGLVVALLGKGILHLIEPGAPFMAASILIAVGGVYLILGIKDKKRNETGHHHNHHKVREGAAALSLFLMLTCSPCEAVVPVFFAASGLGWSSLMILALIMLVCTLTAMGALTILTLSGYEKLRFHILEKNERIVIGLLLICMGLLPIFFQHTHHH